jgi:DNA segregation ATPase FtsK/SpoIIIE-like protein
MTGMRMYTKVDRYRFGIVALCLVSALILAVLYIAHYPYSRALRTQMGDISTLYAVPAWFMMGIWHWFGGIGSVMLILLLLVTTYGVYMRWSVQQEWERVLALFLSVATLCGLSFIYHVDVIQGFVPGGMIGFMVGTAAQYLAGVHMAVFFLYCLLVCELFVFARCAHLQVAQMMVRVATSWYLWAQEKQIARHMYSMMRWCIGLFYRFMQACGRWVSAFARGTIFEHASLTVPDDHELHAQKIQELYSILHASLPSDTSSAEAHMPDDQERYASASHDATQDALPLPVMERSVATASTAPYAKQGATSAYALPDLSRIIDRHDHALDTALTKELQAKAVLLQEKLQRFGVSGTVVAIKRGPVVTLYEYQPSIDTKISKIIALEDDLALALQALSIRIIAPIPGREVVGFEVSNTQIQPVMLASVFVSDAWCKGTHALPLALGVDTVGTSMVVDLVTMPHLLIAGSTGSGKSVALNTMLISLICRRTPDELKLILIDPKRLEFAAYVDIPHLLFPIVADPRRAAPVLRWVVTEMEERYEHMARAGVRTIKEYNRVMAATPTATQLPLIVVVIDELSDLMMTAGRDVEDAIARLAQMARAAGIHLIVATQRPSVDVLTGLIKVNFPSRISFRVTSRIDSRTILDCGGAEKLLGRGDMLFLDAHTALLRRLHGAYIADTDIQHIVAHIRSQRLPEYRELTGESGEVSEHGAEENDLLYQEVLTYIDSIDEISISLLQRRFRIGFNRSARIIDYLEKQGRIMPPEGSKSRKVIH